MGLYDFHTRGELPNVPVRTKGDVLEIVKRWEDGLYHPAIPGCGDDIDFGQLEEDIHALAHIAMQHLPD